MRLRDIALANLKVRKTKTGFLLLGILLCLGTLLSLYLVVHHLRVELAEQLQQVGFRFLITPAEEPLAVSYQGVVVGEGDVRPITLPQGYLEEMGQLDLPGLDLISPKLVLAGELKGQPLIISGLEFSRERVLQDWWILAEGAFPDKREEVLLGADNAERFALRAGEEVLLFGKSYLVAGILAPSGSSEDGLLMMDLQELQDVTGTEGLSFIELRFQWNEEEGGTAVQERQLALSLKDNLPLAKITRVQNENLLRRELVNRFMGFAMMTAIVVFMISWLMMAMTIASSVKERVGEIGILRAMGYRQGHIIKVILWETGVISGIGGCLGYFMGVGLAALILPLFGSQGSSGVGSPGLFAAALGVSLLIGLSAGYYPAHWAAKLDPVQALRQL